MVQNPPAMQVTWVPSLGWEGCPGERNGNPLQYYRLENPHGQRSLVVYSPRGCKESDMTERLSVAYMVINTEMINCFKIQTEHKYKKLSSLQKEKQKSNINFISKLYVYIVVIVKVTQSCPTLWDPKDYLVHAILHARILEWTAFSFFRGSS